MIRTSFWYAALAIAPLTLMSCDEPDASEGVLTGVFDEAEAETGVPAELLKAIAWSQSHVDNRAGEVNKFGRVGVMGLSTDPEDENSVHAAAELMGVSEAVLIHDVRMQILGTAWLLEGWAIEELGSLPAEREMAQWFYVVGRLNGSGDDWRDAKFSEQVFQSLEQGFIHRTPTGERIELMGRSHGAEPLPTGWRSSADSSEADDVDLAPSCNYSDYSRGVGDIDYVIIHTVQGSYSGCISWVNNCSSSVSPHYVVRSSDGEITQTLSEEDVGWHAGNWDYNLRSIGIEHEGYVDDASWYTEAMYQSSAALVRDICDRYGIPKDRDHIIAHAEVPNPYGSGYGGSSGHTDPGSNWDWDYFMTLVNSGSSSGGSSSGGSSSGSTTATAAVGDLTGYVRNGDIYSGGDIAGATVTLSDGTSASTDATGRFVFYGIEEGAWTLSVSASGYSTASVSKTIVPGILNWSSVALTPTASSGSSSTTTYTPGPPGKPISISPTGGTYTGSYLNLSWTDTGDTAIIHELYVEYMVGGSWRYYGTFDPADTHLALWPIVDDTSYRFAVRGYNTSGWGAWSDWGAFSYYP